MKRLLAAIILCILAPAMVKAGAIPTFSAFGNISGFKEPTRIAVDSYGHIYVSDSLAKAVKIYSGGGALLYEDQGIGKPLGIAVSANGSRAYIGDDTDGSVRVFTINRNGSNEPVSLTAAGALGKGAGEFGMPNAIAVAGSGNVYVVDSTAHFIVDGVTGKTTFYEQAPHIKVYDGSGTSPINSFGKYGKSAGQFEFPVDIAIDETAGILYVGDNISGTIQYFDLSGNCKKDWVEGCEKDSTGACTECKKIGGSIFGSADSKMVRLQGIAVDRLSRIYAVDAFQSEVKVFGVDGSYLTKVGIFGSGKDANGNDVVNSELDHPIDAVVAVAGGVGKLYVSSSNSEKVKAFKIDNYSLMKLSTATLSFTGTAGEGNPSGQALGLTSVDLAPIDWSAGVTQPWISLTAAGGSTPSTLGVGVNTAGLAAGSYSGSINIQETTGTVTTVPVKLTLSAPYVENPPSLSVSPVVIGFSGQVKGAQPESKAITISNSGGGTLNWTAAVGYEGSVGQTWLSIDKSSGSGTGNINLVVNISGLGAGEHRGSITVSAAGAQNSPQTVSVILALVSTTGTITVKSNSAEATYVVSGPESYTGAGIEWTKTEVPEGTYTVTFGKVPGKVTPLPVSGVLAAEKTVTFEGAYSLSKTPESIIAGSGEKASIKVFEINSQNGDFELNKSFSPFNSVEGVKVAAGDIDGDGADEIISALWDGSGNRAWVVISRKDGAELASFMALQNEGRYGATVAAGDIDGDGRAEIAVGGGPGPLVPARVKIYKYGGGKVTDTGVNFIAFDGGYGVNVAFGELDGDGQPELITTPGPNPDAKGGVKIWKIETVEGEGRWSAVLDNTFSGMDSKYGATVASGDLDGDGIAEIILGAGPGPDNTAKVEIYRSNGKLYNAGFSAGNWRYGVSVAAGDILGEDGKAEIVVMPGHGPKNSSTVKVFNAGGAEYIEEIKAFEGVYGGNVAIGRLK